MSYWRGKAHLAEHDLFRHVIFPQLRKVVWQKCQKQLCNWNMQFKISKDYSQVVYCFNYIEAHPGSRQRNDSHFIFGLCQISSVSFALLASCNLLQHQNAIVMQLVFQFYLPLVIFLLYGDYTVCINTSHGNYTMWNLVFGSSLSHEEQNHKSQLP